jgi:hypothetical protein
LNTALAPSRAISRLQAFPCWPARHTRASRGGHPRRDHDRPAGQPAWR